MIRGCYILQPSVWSATVEYVFILSLSGQVARLQADCHFWLSSTNVIDVRYLPAGKWAPIGSLVGRRYLAVAAYLAAVGQDRDNS
jgi:hypothetical protein